MLAYIAPFLVVSIIILCAGSAYYIIENILRSRPPKRIDYTPVSHIDFRNANFHC